MARCTVERLMRELGLRRRRARQEDPHHDRGPGHERAADLVDRDFTADGAEPVLGRGLHLCATWSGDRLRRVRRRRVLPGIVGWSAATNKRTPLVLDALDMGLWRRDRDGHTVEPGLVHHSDAGSQYTSFRFTTHLLTAGIDASIGTVGDALDNALMESTIGLYKTELIKPRGPWHPRAPARSAGSRCASASPPATASTADTGRMARVSAARPPGEGGNRSHAGGLPHPTGWPAWCSGRTRAALASGGDRSSGTQGAPMTTHADAVTE